LTANAASPSQINLIWNAATDEIGVAGYRVYRDGALFATLGNVTSYQNTGLSAATTYSYTVQAVDAAGNASSQSMPASATTPATPDTSAPSTPTGLTATAVSSSRIDLTWTASTDNVGVTRYRLYRNGAFLTLLGNVTSYQNNGLSASTTYSYTVQAIDAAGNASGQSAPASATTPPQSANGTAILTWDPVTAPTLNGYRIYYGTAPGTYLQPIGQGIDVGNVTTYTVTGLGSGTRYYFAATAYDTSNNESTFSNEVFKDTP
jgi:chitodextrinase